MNRILVWIGFALALFRFVNLGDAPFINDEAIFLSAAREQILSGQWLSHNPIMGSTGVYYGPVVIYFYSAVQWIAGFNAIVSIGAMCLMVTGSQVWMCWELSKRFAYSFGVLLVFAMTMPFMFFWSRLAWDQTSLVMPALVVALMCKERGWANCLLIGLCLALGVWSHPMMIPFAACVTTAVVMETWFAAYSLLAAPWLFFFVTGSAPFAWDFSLRRIIETVRPASLFEIDYFFDASSLLMVVVGCFSISAVMAFVAGGLWRRPTHYLHVLAIATLILSPLFYACLGLPYHPHYQFANAWLVVVALTGYPYQRLIVMLSGLHLVVLLWLGYNVHTARGTTGIHYGMPVGDQQQLMRGICTGESPESLPPYVFYSAMKYHLNVTKECHAPRSRFQE